MAYAGTTAASSVANPPMAMWAPAIRGVSDVSTASGGGRRLWLYNSSNATSDQLASNFFTDAWYLGMKQGDIVLGTIATGSSVSVFLGVLSSVTTNGANLASSGGLLSSTR